MYLSEDEYIGIVGVLVGIVLILIALSIPDWRFADIVGASFFPKISSISFFVFSFSLFINSWRHRRLNIRRLNIKEKGNNLFKKISFFVFFILYVIILPIVGFYISSTVFLLIVFLAIVNKLSFTNILNGLLFSVITVTIVGYIFTNVFLILLP